MSKSTAATLASYMKQAAKELAKQDLGLSYLQYRELFHSELKSRIPQFNWQTLAEDIRKERQPDKYFDDATILECPENTQIVHMVAIGDSQWSLRATSRGPELHLDHHPHGLGRGEHECSDLGLFQVMARARNVIGGKGLTPMSWTVSRYGTYLSHSLAFMSDDQVGALSRHFGIPYCEENFWQQQTISESAFLKSHSFRSLRNKLRSGACQMPNLHDWRYGLSILWAHLIAMSDENFSQADHVIDCFFQQRNSKPIQWATQRLEKYWHQIPKLCRNGDETDSGIYALIESQTSA